MKLIETIIRGFEKATGKGLPLGNVTSQLFANIYMNEFDQFAKHILQAKFYARYCDDFVIVEKGKEVLESHIPRIGSFLQDRLKLLLHPNKVHVRKARQGIDFLGQVILPHRNVLRTKTKKRIFRKMIAKKAEFDLGKIDKKTLDQSVASYKGLLSHGKNKRAEKHLDSLLGTIT